MLEAVGRNAKVESAASVTDFERLIASAPDIAIAPVEGGALDAADALRRLSAEDADIPLIVLADPGEEEAAIALVGQGAADYVMTDRMRRLGPSIERTLRESLSRRGLSRATAALWATLENTPNVAVQWYDEVGRVIYWNPASERAFGWPVSEALGRTLDQLILNPASAARFLQSLRTVERTGEPVPPREYEFHRRDGTPGVCLSTVFGIPAPSGGRCFVCMDIDISERKRAEAELRASEARFAAAFHGSPGAISITRASDGRVFDVNDAWLAIMWRSREEVIGRTMVEAGLADWKGPEDRAAFIEPFVRGGWRKPQRVSMPRDGEPPYVGWASMRPIDIGGEPHYLAIMHDISDLEQAQQALQESELRFRQVTETIDEVFWLSDAQTNRLIYLSPAFERIWGRPADALDHEGGGWLAWLHAEDRDRLAAAAARLRETGEYDLEYRVVQPDGEVRWVHDRAFPIRDNAGVLRRVAGISADITERRKLEDQLRQAQKMEAVGQLAGGVAHDFNNLLAVIQMQASMLLVDETLPQVAAENIQEILTASERAGDLIRQLLTFSRRGIARMREVDLRDIVETVGRMLRRILGAHIVVGTELEAGVPLVNADPGMMEQVLMNLAVNARDAMPEGGRIDVSVKPVDITGAASHVCLCVRDTGVGIPPKNLARIFEPFFTTKEVGKGSGLGLSTVFGIVEQHGGWIEVDSEPGKGSLFRVLLPSLSSRPPVAAGSGGRSKPQGGREHILVVEDDPLVRNLARRALESYGYRVAVAENAADALDVMAKGVKVDLLLTDLMMPGGMTGRELAEALVARVPGIRVVFTSGYGAEILEGAQGAAGWHFLQKPYRAAALAEKVRDALDRS
ncbi:MAG: PAS domain S-box protein [Alphaproteobacteria bacterium]|nr:PAS domain S-box protein [Alphaproteobacteria bacterium]